MTISQIDYEAVAQSADGFKTTSEMLNKVNSALQGAMAYLKSDAFIGMVGGAALERYLANIQPKVEQLALKCEEISADLQEVIKIHQVEDEREAGNFQS
ncbi:MAG: hypothetical protein H6672_16710 [Anaerolineaceae bacterium]|nr:hypothetical protein [Anaerolineaceae bacterium]